MIICETRTRQDIPVEYHYRDSGGLTPICCLQMVSGGWDLTFSRGPKHLGPYRYVSLSAAQRHVARYLACHGERLAGPSHSLVSTLSAHQYERGDGCDAMGRPYPDIVVPKRRQRRGRW